MGFENAYLKEVGIQCKLININAYQLSPTQLYWIGISLEILLLLRD